MGKQAAAGRRTAPPKADKSFGEEVLEGLRDVVDTLKAGGMAAVEKKFTVWRVKVPFPRPAYSAADVAAIRGELGVSQTVFAAMLGVSPNTVRAWEQGVNPPSGMAARFLNEVKRNPEYWRGRIEDAAKPERVRLGPKADGA